MTVLAAVLALACVPGAFAAPFTNRAELKIAVDECLGVGPFDGVACCATANCGPAGLDPMQSWNVSLVTDMSELFKDKGQFNADISAWDTSQVTNMVGMFRGRRRLQPRHRIVEYRAGHGHGVHVQIRRRLQPRHRIMEYRAGHEHGADVQWRPCVQPRYRIVEYRAGHEHGVHVL